MKMNSTSEKRPLNVRKQCIDMSSGLKLFKMNTDDSIRG